MARGIPFPTRLEEEPGAPLGLVNPVLDEARGCDVAYLVDDVVHLAQARGEALIVLAQLREHVERIDILGIVVLDALQARNVADRAQRRAAGLTDALRDGIGHRVDLIRL